MKERLNLSEEGAVTLPQSHSVNTPPQGPASMYQDDGESRKEK